MKKTLLLLVSVFCMGLCFSSCGDDDVEKAKPYQKPTTNTTPTEEKEPSKISQGLHVEGKYLKDENGNIVNLHGFCQTYAPHFNQGKWGWSRDFAACKNYNQGKVNTILSNGWCMDFVRLHMDPWWTVKNQPSGTSEADSHTYYNEDNFVEALNNLFIPMAKFFVSHGLVVVMRPPGVCPHEIALNDDYHKYLKAVWEIVANNSYLANNPMIQFELANEPVNFRASDGSVGASGGLIDKELSQFFQEIVDMMRDEGCDNVLWIPGTSWQQKYDAYASYPIQGDNIGYAVHCYPGWYGSDCYQETGEVTPDMWRGSKGGYEGFREGWSKAITKTVGNKAPVIITEMDWSDKKWDVAAPTATNPNNVNKRTWGSSITGEEGGKGFGANFKKIMDEDGNVSFVTFVWDHDLAAYDPSHPADGSDFLYDPESGVVPVYEWFQEYREKRGN